MLSGPAPQPLATVDLRQVGNELQVEGVYGGGLFERFFENFGFRLGMEFGEPGYREPVTGHTVLMQTDQYTSQRVRC